MNVASGSIVYCATIRQDPQICPPFDQVLLLQDGDGPWRFPNVGELEQAGELQQWTDSTHLVRVDAPFKPLEAPDRKFCWSDLRFASGCSPQIHAPNVMPALRRFDGPLIDYVLARAKALADSSTGEIMSSEIRELQRQLDTLKRQVGPPIENRAEFIQAQSRAEPVHRAFNDTAAPPFVGGERLRDYRVRLLTPFKTHSATYRDADLNKVYDATAFGIAEATIYADAMREATHPTTSLRPGELRAIRTTDAAGRTITRWHGDPMAAWVAFTPPPRYARFLTPGR